MLASISEVKLNRISKLYKRSINKRYKSLED